MAQYDYTARNASGDLTSGSLDAADASTVAKILLGRSFIPLEIKENKQSEGHESSGVSFFAPKISQDDLLIFARQMYSLAKSGIPILRAVKGLAETANSPRMARAVILATFSPMPAKSASSSMHSCWIMVESMSAISAFLRRWSACCTTQSIG